MTATPIPRTLAMTAYGDLDVSVIDEMPPGRKPIQTKVFRQSSRSRAYAVIRKQIEAGRQAYIVYPLVEESEKIDLEAATQAAERLQQEEFPHYTIGLLHGRMKSDEKAKVMAAFKDGLIQVLVATTVIEVGLDIPNASVMAIEHADRFGLAQLHQLRGRVGRGAHQSFCLLISSARSSTSADPKEELFQTKDVKFAPELPLGIQETWAARNTVFRDSECLATIKGDGELRGWICDRRTGLTYSRPRRILGNSPMGRARVSCGRPCSR